MRPVDLHPDDLLDRARAGTLTQAEAARLDAHLRQCTACAMEMAWLADGLDDRAPSEEDALCARRVIHGVWGSPDAVAESAPQVPVRRRWALGGAPAITLGVLLTASAAAAAIGDSGFHWVREQLAPWVGTPPSAAEPARPAPTASRKKSRQREPVAVQPPPLASDVAAAAPRPPEHVESERAAGSLRALDVRPRRSNARADHLLKAARTARRAGDIASALRLFDELERDYPDSRARHSSRIAHAQLLLDARGDAVSALALYDRYLQSRAEAPLAEEARLGRARALERLGDRAEALGAWRELLARHPRSIHVGLAKVHIAELSR